MAPSWDRLSILQIGTFSGEKHWSCAVNSSLAPMRALSPFRSAPRRKTDFLFVPLAKPSCFHICNVAMREARRPLLRKALPPPVLQVRGEESPCVQGRGPLPGPGTTAGGALAVGSWRHCPSSLDRDPTWLSPRGCQAPGSWSGSHFSSCPGLPAKEGQRDLVTVALRLERQSPGSVLLWPLSLSRYNLRLFLGILLTGHLKNVHCDSVYQILDALGRKQARRTSSML